MKFQMLIQRLQTVIINLNFKRINNLYFFQKYFEDFPNKINGDISIIAEDLQVKFSEYKRIKKVVFKRQVEKGFII